MTQPLRVLYVTPELAPWAKAGGLGDVAQALPQALRRGGIDVRVLVPAYRSLKQAFPQARPLAVIDAPGGALPPARLLRAERPAGAPALLLLECDAYYDRPGSPYQSPQGEDWPDNALRFGLLARVASLLGASRGIGDWRPDVVHCNDWQTGLAPAWLAHESAAHAASVMTIHNLAYQGLFAPEVLVPLGLPAALHAGDAIALWGRASFLKAGLRYADRLTTVSPTYAREIQGPELGFGLESLLRERSDALSGILNGIDPETWDPARDPLLAVRYDIARLDAKATNRVALRRELGLAPESAAPLFAMIARLVEQKGADLVAAIAPEIVAQGGQLVVLGQGERRFEDAFRALAAQHPQSIAACVAFDDALAHRIEAGADAFLMPSRFEPCGLNQLYSMRYGTPPIVRRTGGLADSVRDLDEAPPGEATGFVFDAPEPAALRGALQRAIAAYRDRATWRRLQENGMRADFSWAVSAQVTVQVYRDALGARAAAAAAARAG